MTNAPRATVRRIQRAYVQLVRDCLSDEIAEFQRRGSSWRPSGLMVPRGWLGGLNLVVYTPEGHLGLFKVRRYGEIVRQAERSRIMALVRSYHKRGRNLKDLLDNTDL